MSDRSLVYHATRYCRSCRSAQRVKVVFPKLKPHVVIIECGTCGKSAELPRIPVGE